MCPMKTILHRHARDVVALGISAAVLVGLSSGSALGEATEAPTPAAETAGFALAPINLDATQRQEIGLTYGTV